MSVPAPPAAPKEPGPLLRSGLRTLLLPEHWSALAAGIAAAGLLPFLVSLLAAKRSSDLVPGFLYLLAVITATLIGRLFAGLLASALSLLMLDRTIGQRGSHLMLGDLIVLVLIFLAVTLAGAHVLARERLARRQAQAEQRRLEAVFGAAQLGLLVVNAETGLMEATNPELDRMLGYSEGELCGQPIAIFTGPHPPVFEHPSFPALVAGEVESVRTDAVYTRRDGSELHAEVVATAVDDETGRRLLVGMIADVAAQRAAAAALRESEGRYRTLVEQLPLVTYRMDLTDPERGLYISPQAEDVLGYPAADHIADRTLWSSRFHPDDAAEFGAHWQKQLQAQQPFLGEYRVLHRDGHTVWVHNEGRFLFDEDGRPLAYQGFIMDISARRAAEVALRASEEQHRQIVENLKEALAIIDLDGVAVWASPSVEQVTGYPPEELRGRNLFELVHPDDEEIVRASAERAFAEGRVELREFRFRHRDGGWRSAEATAARLDRPGEPSQILVAARDIGERIAAEQALARRLRQQEAVAAIGELTFAGANIERLLDEGAAMAMHALNGDSATVVRYNPDTERLRLVSGAGFSPDPAETELSFAVDDPGSVAAHAYKHGTFAVADLDADPHFAHASLKLALEARSVLATPIGRHGALSVYSRETREFDLSERLYLQAFSNVLAQALDRLEAEQQLARSEANYRSIVNTAEEGIWVIDAQERTIFANPKLAQILGYPDEKALLGRRPPEFIAPAGLDAYQRAMGDRQRGHGGQYENVFQRSDGEEVWLHISASPLHDEDGRVIGGLSMVTDISERRNAESKLVRLARQNELLLSSAGESIFGVDAQTRISFMNPAAGELLGYRPEEIVSQSLHEIVHGTRLDEGSHSTAECPLVQAIRSGERVWIDSELFFHRDGHDIPVQATVSPMRDEAGALVGGVVVVRDISTQRLLEEQFRQAQKMEAVGQLAGGIAHDFNNLLTVITGHSDTLARYEQTDKARHSVEEIQRAADRATRLTRQLLLFSRKQVSQPTALDLNEVISSFERMGARLIGEHIEVLDSLAEDLPPITGDAYEIEQCLMNLAVNARDAMPDGGTLTITTCLVVIDDEHAEFLRTMPGRYVELSVADTGIGMDEQTKQHIFEPFYTTKGLGEGTGLGLATVYGIIEQAGGRIAVDSAPGRGTRFRIYLPALADDALATLAPDSGAGSDELLRGDERILVAEDEEMVRLLVLDMLQLAGYDVTAAANGEEALKLIGAAGPDAFDLLITDVVMPGISGRELAERFSATQPAATVIFTSGYTGGAISQQRLLDADAAYLAKPFTAVALTHKIRQELDRARERP